MFKERKRWVRCSVLAALSAGFIMGTGVMSIEAYGHYTVSNSYEDITDTTLSYNNNDDSSDGTKYTSTVLIPSSVKGGHISFDLPTGSTISGDFNTGTSDPGNEINGSVIDIAKGYTGTVDIPKKLDNSGILSPVGAGNQIWLDMGVVGDHINAAVIHSDQEGTSTAASDTKINVGNNTQFEYKMKDTTDARFYGIYNSHGTLTVGDNVGLNYNESSKFIGYGTIGKSDDGTSSISTSGIFSKAGASTTIGNSLKLVQHINSKGFVKGAISGIDSGTMEDTERNTLHIGDNTSGEITFTGKGLQSNNPDVIGDENALSLRGMLIANSDFSIGNYNNMAAYLENNSTAGSVFGAIIRKSKTVDDNIGMSFQADAFARSGTVVDQITGIRISDNSQVIAGDFFDAGASSNGYSNQSDALGVFSNSSLATGKYTFISNSGTGSNSHDKEKLATAVHAEENSQIKMGAHASIYMRATDKNVSHVAGIDLIDSRLTMGDSAKIEAVASNLDYDPESVLYGAHVKKNTTASGDASLNIGKESKIIVVTNNVGQTVGLRNSYQGIASLGDNSTITVAQTPTYIADPENIKSEDIQQGHSGDIAGFLGYNANKTTFGNGVSINIEGNTDTNTSSAYGTDTVNSDLETGDNFTVNVNTKGYAVSYGLSNKGNDSSHISTTHTGKNLSVNMTGDGYAYGIYSGEKDNPIAQTITEDNPTVTVKAKNAVGIASNGSQGTVIMGDNATVSTEGSNASFGILNQYGGNTTFNGAATITSATSSGAGYAAYSMDEGSLIDIRGEGQKQIIGNLMSRNDGTILLNMDTGNSFLTGMSTVRGGTTNIEMSNGSLWNMTDSSAVTKLDLNSGAKVDMTYNPKGYHTLTIDNFTGNGGEFHMKSDLASMTDGDKVHITTSTPGSSGQISVYDQSLATGTMMTGVHHLLMVTDASENATFSGKDLDTGGLWDITATVERGGTFTDANGKVVGSSNEWYLVQTAKKPNEDTTPIIDNIDNTYGLYRLSIDTLRQRLGDLRYRNRSDDKYDFWVRDRHGRFDGHGYDSKYNFLQIGVDTMPNEKSAYGFLVERGIAAPHFDTGSGKNHTLAGALYATWIGDHGNYTDIVAKVGRNDTTLHTYGAYADKASYREDEKSLSFEYGRTLPMGSKGYFFEPQAQIVFGHLGSNSYTTRRGTHVHEDSFDSAIGRLGFVLGKKQKDGENPHDFYLKASILHEFGGDRDYSLRRMNAYGDEESLDGSYNYRDTWVEVGFGGNVKINANTSFYADVERSFGSDYTKKWQINAGINWSF